MQLNRLYYNAAKDLLRMDTINISLSVPSKEIVTFTFGDMVVQPQESRATTAYYGSGSRVVSTIEVVGDYTGLETASGNFTWATWTLGSGQIITSDMSNLPIVGNSV